MWAQCKGPAHFKKKAKSRDGHCDWNRMGEYRFDTGSGGHVKITLAGKGTLYADAVKFLPV